jgi:hypothetical protein
VNAITEVNTQKVHPKKISQGLNGLAEKFVTDSAELSQEAKRFDGKLGTRLEVVTDFIVDQLIINAPASKKSALSAIIGTNFGLFSSNSAQQREEQGEKLRHEFAIQLAATITEKLLQNPKLTDEARAVLAEALSRVAIQLIDDNGELYTPTKQAQL